MCKRSFVKETKTVKYNFIIPLWFRTLSDNYCYIKENLTLCIIYCHQVLEFQKHATVFSSHNIEVNIVYQWGIVEDKSWQ